MIARFAGLFTMCLLTTGAAMVPVEVTPARARLERLVQHHDMAAVVHYQPGYIEWRLSSLVYLKAGFDGTDLMQSGSQKALPALERTVELRNDFWPTFEDGPARMRSAFLRVRISFAVSEWLEAVWTAMRSVVEYGTAWSRALLFSRE